MNVVMISGGALNREFVLEFLHAVPYDCIVVADKGLQFCHAEGIRPNYIVGDFDSLPGGILESYENDTQVQIKRLMPEKDDSDTECAMHLAMGLGADSIYLLGATGTRFDHMMANLQLLAYARIRGISMCMADANNLITVLNGETVLRQEDQYGNYVSFFSMGDEVTNLNLRGFKYPLVDYRLTNTSCGLSLSNEIVSEEAVVSFDDGLLVMVQSRD